MKPIYEVEHEYTFAVCGYHVEEATVFTRVLEHPVMGFSDCFRIIGLGPETLVVDKVAFDVRKTTKLVVFLRDFYTNGSPIATEEDDYKRWVKWHRKNYLPYGWKVGVSTKKEVLERKFEDD